MRPLLLTVWLFLPLAGLAYHYGPGQERLAEDRAAAHAERAAALAAEDRHHDAVTAYDEALAALPAERVAAARRLRLEKAKSQLHASQLPSARADLGELLAELEDDPEAHPEVVTETREALANAQYYMTWLLRLEGAPREEWTPEVEASRQHYRLLAEAAPEGEAGAQRRADLAAAVKLARMDLGDLQGLPLPSQ